MNVKACGFFLVVLLLVSPEVSDAQWWYGGGGRGFNRGGRGFRGRGFGRRGFRGRGLGRNIARGAALIGGLYLIGAALRGKRSVDVYDEIESNPYEDALESFDLAFELDDDMCLEKTLCNIMATSETQKNPSRILKILRTIYSGDMPLLGVEGHDEATKLLEAGLLGKTAKTEEVCKIAFKTCKESPETLKEELESTYEDFGDKE